MVMKMLVYNYPSRYYRSTIDQEDSRVQTIKNCNELLEVTLPDGVAGRLEELVREKDK